MAIRKKVSKKTVRKGGAKGRKKVGKAARRRVVKPKKTTKPRGAVRKSGKKAVGKTKLKKASPRAAKKTSGSKPVGRVIHFYTGIKVAVIKFSKPVQQGTQIRFTGATTDFSQRLDSMQYDHKAIAKAPKGKQVGVKVKSRVREGDQVYL